MKEYIKPILNEEIIEVEDVIAASTFGKDEPGDVVVDFWND